jgi:outer membrane protein assembly factor BamB
MFLLNTLMKQNLPRIQSLALLLSALALPIQDGRAADQPQWGQAWTRNMVSAERNLIDSFDPETGRNVKWAIPLGTETHSTPVIASGRVFIGTNNETPRDSRHQGDRGVFMCLDEQDGHLLWQLVVPKREEDPYHDWPKTGISSPATVEGDRVYLVSNRGEVVCLDIHGMANGNDGPYQDEGRHMTPPGEPAMMPGSLDADILWILDLTRTAGIWSHDAAHSSILIDGSRLYLNSGTGVDNTHIVIRTPDAPSLVVVDKYTGALLARDREQIAPTIFHCTWSSPALATFGSKKTIVFAGGNGVVYGFQALSQSLEKPSPDQPQTDLQSLTKLWQFDPDPEAPKTEVHKFNRNRREGPSNIYGMPVVDGDRIYVAGGGDIFWGKNEAWIKCIQITGSGDTSSASEIWSFPLGKHVLSTPALHEGMLFIADCERQLHCLDAKTGKPYWTQAIKGDVWASPYVADGKVYLGTRSGEFTIMAASKTKHLLSQLNLIHPISATATAANGVLYVATMNQLFALQPAH